MPPKFGETLYEVSMGVGEKIYLAVAQIWSVTVFTDKKRFCLDGSDLNTYYWNDKRIFRASFSKCQKGEWRDDHVGAEYIGMKNTYCFC